MNDFDLLRTFEPVVRYTQGELFFPCAVDGYVRRCSLLMLGPDGTAETLVPVGDLTLERLAEFSEVPVGHSLSLRFVQTPLRALDLNRWMNRPDRPGFRARGRLARVGLVARFLDSLFSLSLLIRGRVPGGTTAAAEIAYRQIASEDPRVVYYGRVTREGGYIVLNYLFFFAMNPWRTGYGGANDHEADWEQIFVYLSDEADQDPVPRWVAYASHDFHGDDLRRRWDDPELEKVDNRHPVIYAGAGSHASYYSRGEYIMGVEPSFLAPVERAIRAVRHIWFQTLRQGNPEQRTERPGPLITIPFVDYARGDGFAVGPGCEHSWSPIVIANETLWAQNYRGLWGLDTRDRFGGERAPAGPKFNRDGSVRVSWYDALGWAGLGKVPPPDMVPGQLAQQIEMLAGERAGLAIEIAQKRESVRLLALEVQALHETDYLSRFYMQRHEKLQVAQSELAADYARFTEIDETLSASESYLRRVERGEKGDPQAHLQRVASPQPVSDRGKSIGDLWAAVSGGLVLGAFSALFLWKGKDWWLWCLVVLVVFFAIEAATRRRLSNYLLNLTMILAVFTALLLIKDFWRQALVVTILLLPIGMIVDNLREVFHRA